MALSVSRSHLHGVLPRERDFSSKLSQCGFLPSFLPLIVTHARSQQCNCFLLSGVLPGFEQCAACNRGSGKTWWWLMSQRNLKIPSPSLSGCMGTTDAQPVWAHIPGLQSKPVWAPPKTLSNCYHLLVDEAFYLQYLT